jgi:hypothetical protein
MSQVFFCILTSRDYLAIGTKGVQAARVITAGLMLEFSRFIVPPNAAAPSALNPASPSYE